MLSKLLLLHQGLKLKPYRGTAGKLVIGVGRNLEDAGISREEALHLLENDVARVRSELSVTIPWYRQLAAPHRAVLEELSFHLGTAGLLRCNEILALFQAGRHEEAAREVSASCRAFPLGDGPPGQEERADRLAQMTRSGEWPAEWT
jgi:lysozyme